MSKILTGRVTSTKMTKTVVVEVSRVKRHPVYQKVIKKSRKFKAHNEKPDIKEGDVVRIQETRPQSRDKHFVVIEKVTKNL